MDLKGRVRIEEYEGEFVSPKSERTSIVKHLDTEPLPEESHFDYFIRWSIKKPIDIVHALNKKNLQKWQVRALNRAYNESTRFELFRNTSTYNK